MPTDPLLHALVSSSIHAAGRRARRLRRITMAKSKKTTPQAAGKSRVARSSSRAPSKNIGAGGETHQTSTSPNDTLTTNQGMPISDNQNQLKAGPRGPV